MFSASASDAASASVIAARATSRLMSAWMIQPSGEKMSLKRSGIVAICSALILSSSMLPSASSALSTSTPRSLKNGLKSGKALLSAENDSMCSRVFPIEGMSRVRASSGSFPTSILVATGFSLGRAQAAFSTRTLRNYCP